MATGSSPEDQPQGASQENASRQPGSGTAPDAARPDWADGLRQLYDSVVDEPLPDTFKDLLAQFDDSGPDDQHRDANGAGRGHS